VTTNTGSPEAARAHLVAAELIAEHELPFAYERMHHLVALAYLRGIQDHVRDALTIIERVETGVGDKSPSGHGWSEKA